MTHDNRRSSAVVSPDYTTEVVESRWPAERIVQAFRTWSLAHDAEPLQWHWRYEGDANPSETRVRRAFGDWQTLRESAHADGGLAEVLLARAGVLGGPPLNQAT